MSIYIHWTIDVTVQVIFSNCDTHVLKKCSLMFLCVIKYFILQFSSFFVKREPTIFFAIKRIRVFVRTMFENVCQKF